MCEITCRGFEADAFQIDHPHWDPLLAAVGERLTSGFMWMQEETLEDGRDVQAYKHRHTRRYLYLTDGPRAFERAACGRFVPLRLDFAIQRALCTWWLLRGWEPEDVEAIKAAVTRGARIE
ncbi:MAG TPA: hypothetical protein VNZ62_10630 [Capillimicrobium sp.]|nr:hypothetical protein [Capillimicrobium sp.]